MRLIHHPSSRFDVLEIVEFYRDTADATLAADFYAELLETFDKIAERPRSFQTYVGDTRRANLNRFPHHVVFEIIDDTTIAIILVRHDHRDPENGLDRAI